MMPFEFFPFLFSQQIQTAGSGDAVFEQELHAVWALRAAEICIEYGLDYYIKDSLRAEMED